jgi:NAD(P)-dependent dehydrogenase (short-subunit alcohol dehydrogenase family)
MQISGCSAIVTGGTGGMGEATVRRLHAAGARVVVADVADEKGKALEQELGVRYMRTDATDEGDVRAAMEEAAALGPLRISVAAHGGPASGGRLLSKAGEPMDLAGFETTIRYYLTAVFNVMRLAAAAIARQEPADGAGRGVIVNTASIAAFEGQIGQAAYSASKGGVAAMTLPIAREFAQIGVRVNTIAPGIFMTPMLMGLPQAARDSLGASVPFPARLGAPAEFAALAVHIVENGYINGETIRIDGALRMAPR